MSPPPEATPFNTTYRATRAGRTLRAPGRARPPLNQVRVPHLSQRAPCGSGRTRARAHRRGDGPRGTSGGARAWGGGARPGFAAAPPAGRQRGTRRLVCGRCRAVPDLVYPQPPAVAGFPHSAPANRGMTTRRPPRPATRRVCSPHPAKMSIIRKQAPAWKTDALVAGGDFKSVSSSDFAGKCECPARALRRCLGGGWLSAGQLPAWAKAPASPAARSAPPPALPRWCRLRAGVLPGGLHVSAPAEVPVRPCCRPAVCTTASALTNTFSLIPHPPPYTAAASCAPRS